ncbi:hypothetical protein [uncultured Cetobacterium sp.]|uniref:hypothetical protein n=1 Tax=uncultured Cetobacterium sp. TaxID=527638 RepID=UPI00260BE567|nr:hypothetical protein [uncultured Cetobacterium sp.]
MGYKKSFSEAELKYWSEYKVKIGKSESMKETKKIFSMVIADFVKEIEPELNPVYNEFDGDFQLDVKETKGYKVSKKIDDSPYYRNLVEFSDLPSIIEKYAEMGINKIIRQSKNQENTNGKKIIH